MSGVYFLASNNPQITSCFLCLGLKTICDPFFKRSENDEFKEEYAQLCKSNMFQQNKARSYFYDVNTLTQSSDDFKVQQRHFLFACLAAALGAGDSGTSV